jgi:hypothetical protein
MAHRVRDCASVGNAGQIKSVQTLSEEGGSRKAFHRHSLASNEFAKAQKILTDFRLAVLVGVNRLEPSQNS